MSEEAKQQTKRQKAWLCDIMAEEPTTPPPMTTPPRKASVRLQERRGSYLSLLVDVSSLGAEPVCAVTTPKEVWLQLLHTSSRPLTHQLLQQAAADAHALQAEYQGIPPNFVSTSDLDVPGHAIKDRYQSILPNPESRVILTCTEEEGGPDRYINANYIRGYGGAPRAYIATQGPMVHTVGDFWDMVWQERSRVIVMVTRLKEANEKCERYWPHCSHRAGRRRRDDDGEEEPGPEEEGTDQFGRFRLRVTDSRDKDGFTVTDMEIELGRERRPVRHYWFTSWPDHHVPQCTAPLLRLVQEVESHSEALRAAALPQLGPVVVHCRYLLVSSLLDSSSDSDFLRSAGVGRTGCFIASSVCCRQLRQTGRVDILETVCRLRLDRGGMIQTPEQYQFLYTALARFSSQLQQQQEQDKQKHPEHQVSEGLQNLQLDAQSDGRTEPGEPVKNLRTVEALTDQTLTAS